MCARAWEPYIKPILNCENNCEIWAWHIDNRQTITKTLTSPELFNVSDRQHWVSKGHLAAKVARRAQGLEPVSCGEQHRKRPIRCVVYDCLVRVRTCGSGLGFHPQFVYLTFGAVSSSIRHLHSPREARASVQPNLVISLDSRAVDISRLITIMWGEPVIKAVNQQAYFWV